jgi:predicted O-methyltransferase YrrM
MILNIFKFDKSQLDKDWVDRAILYLRGGNTTQLEYSTLLYNLIINLRPKKILEIGTARGFSAAVIAKALSDSNSDAQFVTYDIVDSKTNFNWHASKHSLLDPFKDKFVSRADIWNVYDEHKQLSSLIQFESKSLSECFDKLNSKIDFVFIDGDHTYNGVKKDFVSIEKYLSDDAVVMFDDYNCGEEYSFYLRRFKISAFFKLFGVHKFVNDLICSGKYIFWYPFSSDFKRAIILVKK